MEKWKGKVAVVTGASSGIGKEIAIRLVEVGVKVIGIARREEKVAELSKKLMGKMGRLYSLKCDVTNEEEVLEAFKWIDKNVGTVQILINNAGVARKTTLIDGCTSQWQQVISTNLMAVCICTREAIRAIRGPNGVTELPGHIIHINSVLGHHVSALVPYSNVYPATKFGVTALAETLTVELNNLKSRIKVTSISPGLVRTEIATANGANFGPEILEQMKVVPILDPEDVADAVIYVLSTKPHVVIKELIIEPLGEQL